MPVKSVLVRLRGDNGDLNRALLGSAAASKVLGKNLDDADKNSKKLSDGLEVSNDRTTMLIQSALALGPALVPLGAQAVPVVAGLTTQMGFAAAAAGVTALAFSGVGKALKATNDYALEPTSANFMKMEEALAKLGPAGRDFVAQIQDMRPKLEELQNIAQAGMLPGVTDGLENFMDRLPQVERIVSVIATTLGDLSSDAGKSLAGPEWNEFFDFVEREANPMLSEMSRSFGNILLGIANMVEALGPMSSDFSSGLLGMSRDFKTWSADLENSQGFHEFADYVERTGPKVWDTLGALATAMLDIVEAAAPVGEVSLPIIQALAKVISGIADSPAGPALIATAAGFSAISRSIALYNAANGSALFGMLTKSAKEGRLAGLGMSKAGVGYRAAGAGLGVFALSMTDADEKMGLSNTAMLAMIGMVAGPWGAAIGAGVGLTLDLAAANDDLENAVRNAHDAMDTGGPEDQRKAYQDLQAQIAATKTNMDQFWSRDRGGEGMFDTVKGDVQALGAWLTGGTSEAEGALDELKIGMRDDADLAGLLGGALGLTADQMRVMAGEAQSLSGALAQLAGWLDKRAAIRGYEESLDKLSAGLKKNSKAWSEQGEAGRANNDLLDSTAKGIMQVATQMKNTRVRNNFLQGARADLLAMGKQFPGAKAQIRGLIHQLDTLGLTHAKPRVDPDTKGAKNKLADVDRQLGKIGRRHPKPKVETDTKGAENKWNDLFAMGGRLNRFRAKPKTETDTSRVMGQWNAVWVQGRRIDGIRARPQVFADTSQARGALAGVQSQLASMHDKTITLHTVMMTSYVGKREGMKAADGDFVPKTGLPYADRHPYLLADGEGITTNRHGETDRFRDVVEGINAGMSRLQIKGMLADGGFPGRHPQPTSARFAGGGGGGRQVIEVRVSGEMDLRRATAQIREMAREVSQGEIEAFDVMNAEIERAR